MEFVGSGFEGIWSVAGPMAIKPYLTAYHQRQKSGGPTSIAGPISFSGPTSIFGLNSIYM